MERSARGDGKEERGREKLSPLSSFPSPLALLSFLKRDDWGRVSLRLKALLKPLTKMYKPRAFKRQFAVAHYGREKTIYSGGSKGGARGIRPPTPPGLFLDQTEARIVSLAALLGERCVTSKKRLGGRLRPEEPKKNFWETGPPSPI